MTIVLVIEDEEPLREQIVEMLNFEGFDVLAAQNGRIGLEQAHQHNPDVIVCDVSMPEMDGYEVLLALRGDAKTAKIPFIFLTARAGRPFMRHGMELGADDYITKPFTNNELLAAIYSRLNRRSVYSEANPEHLESAKKNLVQMVAHELRTPLIAINMVQEIIARQFNDLSQSGLEELLDIQRSGSDRLSHLIEQMVLLTQLEAGVVNADVISSKQYTTQTWALLSKAVDLARKFAYRQADTSIKLNARDQEAEVACEPAALTHAFAELMANALDFSRPGGQVLVTQWRTKQTALVSIVDQGKGMTPEQLQYAMERFQQVDREKQEQQGMGMGLFLARRVIEEHNGTLDIKSVVDKGTQITIELPLANPGVKK